MGGAELWKVSESTVMFFNYMYNWHVFENLVVYYRRFVDDYNFECCSLFGEKNPQGNIKKPAD